MEINGKKVVDAKKHLNVEVIKDDCAKGKTKDPAACAAARAIMREHDDVMGARVHRGITYLEYRDKWVRYITPTSLRTELTVFDRGAQFEPGHHCLGAPSSGAQSLAAQAERRGRADNTGGAHSKNKGKRPRHEIPNIRPRGANR